MADGSGQDYVDWLDTLWADRARNAGHARPELNIGIVLWPRFPLLSLAGIVETLRHAGDVADASRRLRCDWAVIGSDSTPVYASSGFAVVPDSGYRNPTDFDYIAVIGGLLPDLASAPVRHRDYLRAAAALGVPLIGVCTGSFVLAAERLLDRKRVCVHPFHADDFRAVFPRHRVVTRQDYLIDGDRITVAGGTSILALMLELISVHCGPDRASKTVHQVSVTNAPDINEFDRARISTFTHSADTRMQKAVILIDKRSGKRCDVSQIATEVGLSTRQFNRIFKESFGCSPKSHIVKTRLRHARWIIENTSRDITDVAYETGFADCAHLATSFKRVFGMTPTQARSKVPAMI